jgi:uncharacterized protein YecT (DUF1311 family)
MKTPALIVLFTIVIHIASAQTSEDENIIDKRWKDCIDKDENQTTAGMVECTVRAAEEWEKELNKNYNLLMGKLNTEEKEKLRLAQRNWLAYRDKELEFAATMYTNLEGTMWRIAIADRRANLTKQRAVELKAYYDDLN